MNALFVTVFAALALCVAASAPGGVLLKGPSGIVTGAGPIGPNGPAGHGVVVAAPAIAAAPALAAATIAGPAAIAAPALWGAGTAAIAAPAVWGAGPAAIAAPALWGAGRAIAAAPAIGLGLGGAGIVGRGLGSITIGHGVTVAGPPTAPAVIAGPAGKIAADGLWGPTLAGGGKW